MNQEFLWSIDHFTVVCSVTWPLYGSKARVDLVLIQTSLLLSCKCTYLASEQLVLHNKSSEVCIKTRSTLASLPYKGQVTEQTTVKWSIMTVLISSAWGLIWISSKCRGKCTKKPFLIQSSSCQVSLLEDDIELCFLHDTETMQ